MKRMHLGGYGHGRLEVATPALKSCGTGDRRHLSEAPDPIAGMAWPGSRRNGHRSAETKSSATGAQIGKHPMRP